MHAQTPLRTEAHVAPAAMLVGCWELRSRPPSQWSPLPVTTPRGSKGPALLPQLGVIPAPQFPVGSAEAPVVSTSQSHSLTGALI